MDQEREGGESRARDEGPIEDRGRIRIASQRAVGIWQTGVSQNGKDVRRGGKPEGATARHSGFGKNGGREETGKSAAILGGHCE